MIGYACMLICRIKYIVDDVVCLTKVKYVIVASSDDVVWLHVRF